MPMIKNLAITSSRGRYIVKFKPITSFENGLMDGNSIFICDKTLFDKNPQIFAKLDRKKTILYTASENKKTLEGAIRLLEQLQRLDIGKNSKLISAGGGITQDVTGFVTSVIFRGVKWVYIPTTLLAQADSCVGGKTSLNFKSYKNFIGTFNPPSEIIITTEFLKTLPLQDFKSGLGELIKILIIGTKGKNLSTLSQNIAKVVKDPTDPLLSTLIRKSLEIKKYYVEKDEFDSGVRNVLNWGHTYGHALESVSDFKIPHGSAVVFGMILANAISVKRGILDREKFKFFNSNLFLPLTAHLKIDRNYFNQDLLLDKMGKDKKKTGKDFSFMLLSDNYKLRKFGDIKEAEILSAQNTLLKLIFEK